MATPADQRLLELLEKWLKSLELHLRYSSLNDDSYAAIQPWPEHQRPSRWIIDLARQKALALHAQVQERIEMGDAKFSDSLELMSFLANLLGGQHIERFIPLADADSERVVAQDAAAEAATGTREMPIFPGSSRRAPPAPGAPQVARGERKAHEVAPAKAAPAAAVSTAAAASHPDAPSGHGVGPEAAREQVIVDAARLVQWGRKWYELAELISGMADRPSLTEVRRILKDNKTVIDKKAGRG